MSASGREEFFANSAGLFNADLKTSLTTAITKSILERVSSKLEGHGNFEDYDELKEKTPKKEFEELCQKGSVIDHPIHEGKKLVWNPKYSMTITMETVMQEERKRQLEQYEERKVKRPKRAKEEQTDAEPGAGAAADAEAPGQPVPFTLLKGHKKRLDLMLPKVTQALIGITETMAEGGRPENVDAVSKKLMDFGNKTKNDGDALQEVLTKIQTDATAESKDKLILYLDTAKDFLSAAKDANTRVKNAIDENWEDTVDES